MSRLFTVVEKELVLNLLKKAELPKFVNNIGYSQSCCDTVFEVAEESYFTLGNILPCIKCDDSDFAEALTERFPINWKTHMYLRVDIDDDRVFNIKHSVLLDLSSLPEPIDTEEAEQYHQLLLSDLNSDFNLGVSNNPGDINFLTDFAFEDITGFLILDADFDPHEDTDVKITAEISRKSLEEAVQSSVFGG